jgi:hypothetical protein
MGGTYDLPLAMWFGDFSLRVTVHVIDSARPQSLPTLFMGGANADRIVVWDDGTTEHLMEEKKAWEIAEVRIIVPRRNFQQFLTHRQVRSHARFR